MDVLGYLGASLWRFLALWVRLLVGTLRVFSCVLGCTRVCILTLLFWYVFTQGYLDPVRPRAPRTPVRAYLCACAPTCVSFSAPCGILGASVSLWLRHVVPRRSVYLS